MLILVVE